jgi:hypothetical protein
MAKEIAFKTTPVYRAKCVPGGVLHHCRKCAKETEHHYVAIGRGASRDPLRQDAREFDHVRLRVPARAALTVVRRAM